MATARLFTLPFLLSAFANASQATSFNLFLHLPAYLNVLGASDFIIGVIFGVTGFAAIAARPPIGRVIDTYGRRRVIVLGGVLNVISVAGYLAVTSIGPWIVFVRLLHGVAEGILFTSLATYGADCVPEERRTQGLSLFAVSTMLPIAGGAWLGEAIVARAGYEGMFQAAVAFASLSLLLSLGLPERRPTPSVGEELPHGFVAALRQRDLLPLWWVATVFSVALAGVFTFLKRYVDETGIGSVSMFFAAHTSIALVLRIGFGWLPDHLGPVRVLIPSLGMVAGSLALLSYATTGTHVMVSGLLLGVGHGYAFPILFGMVLARARDADRGSAVGIFTSLFDVGSMLGGPLFGAVIVTAGFSAMYGVAGTLVVLGTGVFLLWDARAHRV